MNEAGATWLLFLCPLSLRFLLLSQIKPEQTAWNYQWPSVEGGIVICGLPGKKQQVEGLSEGSQDPHPVFIMVPLVQKLIFLISITERKMQNKWNDLPLKSGGEVKKASLSVLSFFFRVFFCSLRLAVNMGYSETDVTVRFLYKI